VSIESPAFLTKLEVIVTVVFVSLQHLLVYSFLVLELLSFFFFLIFSLLFYPFSNAYINSSFSYTTAQCFWRVFWFYQFLSNYPIYLLLKFFHQQSFFVFTLSYCLFNLLYFHCYFKFVRNSLILLYWYTYIFMNTDFYIIIMYNISLETVW